MIYKLIRERRIALGISQEQIAKAIGTRQPNYNSMERGANDIKLSTFLKILAALKIDNTKIEKLLCESLPKSQAEEQEKS
jgi:transcriptional regulator with XRE-family HTH domain